MVIRSRKIKRTRTVCVDDAHRGWNDTKVPVCVYTHTAYVHYSNRAPPSLHLIVQCCWHRLGLFRLRWHRLRLRRLGRNWRASLDSDSIDYNPGDSAGLDYDSGNLASIDYGSGGSVGLEYDAGDLAGIDFGQ